MLSLVITYVEEVFNFFNLGGCSVYKWIPGTVSPSEMVRVSFACAFAMSCKGILFKPYNCI